MAGIFFIGVCCVSSVCSSAYMAYTAMQESKRQDEIEAREKKYKEIPGFHLFTECDYGNYGNEKGVMTIPLDAVHEFVLNTIEGYKSFILTSGIKVDTYTESDKGGAKMTYTGPASSKCLSNPIMSATNV